MYHFIVITMLYIYIRFCVLRRNKWNDVDDCRERDDKDEEKKF